MINSSKFFVFVCILILKENHRVSSINFKVLPVKSDLPLYLRALERIIESAGTPQNKIDGNFGLGLFLANVNLKSAMLWKNATTPIALKVQIQRILSKNKVLMSFFKYMRTYKYDNYENEDAWAERLQKFHKVSEAEIEGLSKEYLMDEYSHWTWYEKRVLDFDNSIPSPTQSDACMISLTWNPQKPGTPSYRCTTTSECLNFVENGSEFGYALVHRVLFLLVARYSRGCYAFSPQLDAAFVDKLCANIYEEASYIALNKFRSPDLLMEQISTCSLAGHTQFLQRQWLTRLLKQQTAFGCFSTYLNTVYNRVNPQNKQTTLECNSHVSGVAAAALSAFVRYIIETYF